MSQSPSNSNAADAEEPSFPPARERPATGRHAAPEAAQSNGADIPLDRALDQALGQGLDPAFDEAPEEPDLAEPDFADPDAPESFADSDDFPQQDDAIGVTSNMATSALDHSAIHPGARQRGRSVSRAGQPWSKDAESEGAEVAETSRLGLNGEATAAAETGPTDAEIMLRVREGDDSGFDFLIAKYRRQIVHFMFRMVHNQGVAEELAQEVFLRVYRSRATYRAEARFSTWLYRIATNLGVNHARDTKHERAASNIYLDETDSETGTRPDLADSTPTAEQEMLRQERLQAIRKHVMALPERQRIAVLMHKYDGKDYREIGEVLRLSESATKSLLFRAYTTLRESLKEFV